MTKQKESPFTTDWVEALTTFTVDIPHVGTFVKRGTRYPVDNPVVQAFPKNFVDDHLTADEKGQIYNERFFREFPEDGPVTFLPPPLAPEDTVVCTTRLVAYVRAGYPPVLTPRLDNHELGQKFSKRDPIVLEYPDHFSPLVTQEATA